MNNSGLCHFPRHLESPCSELVGLTKDLWLDRDIYTIDPDTLNLFTEHVSTQVKRRVPTQKILSDAKKWGPSFPPLAVRLFCLSIRGVKDDQKTPEVCLAAVRVNGLQLEFVLDQTPEICLAAVENCWKALKFVKNQTPEICLAAVRNCGEALKFVKNQTPEICITTLLRDVNAFRYVRDQTREICLAALDKNPFLLEHIRDQTHEICAFAIWKNWRTFKHVKNQTPELCLHALNKSWQALEYVRDQTPELCLVIVTLYPDALQLVREQTQEICLAAIRTDTKALRHVRDQTREICLFAMTRNLFSQYYIRDEDFRKELVEYRCWYRLNPKKLTIEKLRKILEITKTADNLGDSVGCMICKTDGVSDGGGPEIQLGCHPSHSLCINCLTEWYFRRNNEKKCLYCFKPIDWTEASVIEKVLGEEKLENKTDNN